MSIPPHVMAALAARGGPGNAPPPPDPSAGMMGASPLPGGPPVGPPGGDPTAGAMGPDPGMGGVLGAGMPADPSTPDGVMQLLNPLMMAQQAKVEGLKAEMAHSMAAAMAQAMSNIDNPAGAAAATLPGMPTAPGSDPGGPGVPDDPGLAGVM